MPVCLLYTWLLRPAGEALRCRLAQQAQRCGVPAAPPVVAQPSPHSVVRRAQSLEAAVAALLLSPPSRLHTRQMRKQASVNSVTSRPFFHCRIPTGFERWKTNSICYAQPLLTKCHQCASCSPSSAGECHASPSPVCPVSDMSCLRAVLYSSNKSTAGLRSYTHPESAPSAKACFVTLRPTYASTCKQQTCYNHRTSNINYVN